jgi:hypothetical protein
MARRHGKKGIHPPGGPGCRQPIRARPWGVLLWRACRSRGVGYHGGRTGPADRDKSRAPDRMMGVTYDTGALIAADRGERRLWARHRALLARREVPTVPAPVVAQSWRGGGRQVLLARLLAGCDVEALDDDQARSVGSLATRAATTDIIDACVVEGAMRRHDLVVSSDEGDLQAIAAAISRRLEVDRP